MRGSLDFPTRHVGLPISLPHPQLGLYLVPCLRGLENASPMFIRHGTFYNSHALEGWDLYKPLGRRGGSCLTSGVASFHTHNSWEGHCLHRAMAACCPVPFVTLPRPILTTWEPRPVRAPVKPRPIRAPGKNREPQESTWRLKSHSKGLGRHLAMTLPGYCEKA